MLNSHLKEFDDSLEYGKGGDEKEESYQQDNEKRCFCLVVKKAF